MVMKMFILRENILDKSRMLENRMEEINEILNVAGSKRDEEIEVLSSPRVRV